MTHKPIRFKDLSLIYPHKICFDAFTADVRFGERIAIVGPNGAGKSTLLKMLGNLYLPTASEIIVPNDVQTGYLPQVIEDFSALSGGQRVNQMLTKILSVNPNLLLLDEPTNHLDSQNRRSLMGMLSRYSGTLIIVSHDTKLIDTVTDTLWVLELGRINVFKGSYHAYQQMLTKSRASLEHELTMLARQKKEAHLALMKEQERNKRSRVQGEKKIAQRKWPTVRSPTKLGHGITAGDKRLSQIQHKKDQLLAELSSLYQPEVIKPKFKLPGLEHSKPLVKIQNASIAYRESAVILEHIDFHLNTQERVALRGDNASGKSTLIKACLGNDQIIRTGEWLVPDAHALGYLDQHYQHLPAEETVLEVIKNKMPHASHAEIRTHLNEFLFRKNEEVNIQVKQLSGGEKTRLSLALIAASLPKLLILDEVTNNIDLETRAHLISVLNAFPGAMLVISHDESFIEAIGIDTTYQIRQGKIQRVNDSDEEVIKL